MITQVLVVESEKETGGFLAPSITVLAMEGWKGNATLEKWPTRLKIKLSFGEKLINNNFRDCEYFAKPKKAYS